MATFTERLALLITADGQGAIRELNKVGAAAATNLGSTEARLVRTSAAFTKMGAGLVVGGGVAATGLFKAAEAASSLEEQVTQARVVFGDASVDVEKFAEGAADKFGQSKRAAIAASSSFATFGKAAGLNGKELSAFSTRLVALTGDLASFKDVSTDQVATAITAGLSGEIEPLRRLGIILNDDAVKAEAVRLGLAKTKKEVTDTQKVLARNSLIFNSEVAKDALGDFERTADGMANSMRIASAEWENAKAAFGESSKPLFTSAIQGATNLLQSFNGLSPAAQSVVGSFATFATAGAIAVGALSLIAGQAIKLREVLTTVGPAGERSLNRLGVAARGAATLLSALAIGDLVGDLMNGDVEGRVSKEMDAIAAAAARGGADIIDEFNKAASSRDAEGHIADIWKAVGKEFRLGGKGSVQDIEIFEETFARLKTSSKEAAQAFLDALKVQNRSASGTDQLETLKLIAKWQQELSNSNAAATLGQTETAIANLGGAAADAAPEVDRFGFAIKRAADGTEIARSRFEEYADGIRRSIDPLMGVVDATRAVESADRNLASTQRQLAKARQEAAKGDESALRRIADAQRDIYRAQNTRLTADFTDLDSRRDLLDAQAKLKEAQEDLAQSKRDAQERVSDLQQQVRDANFAAGKAGMDLYLATIDLAKAIEENPKILGNALATLDEMVRGGFIDAATANQFKQFFVDAAGQVDNVTASVDELGKKLDQLNGKTVDVTININESGGGFEGIIARARAKGMNGVELPGAASRERAGAQNGPGEWTPEQHAANRRRNDAITRANNPDLEKRLAGMSVEEFMQFERFLAGAGGNSGGSSVPTAPSGGGGGGGFAGIVGRARTAGLQRQGATAGGYPALPPDQYAALNLEMSQKAREYSLAGDYEKARQISSMSVEEYAQFKRFLEGIAPRAGGGEVLAGSGYQVNERGLEGFQAAGSSVVTPLGGDGASIANLPGGVPVPGGTLYDVAGMQAFVPDVSGQIIPDTIAAKVMDAPRRASGGPVFAGSMYRINERGVEGFAPSGVMPAPIEVPQAVSSTSTSSSSAVDQRDMSIHLSQRIVTADPMAAARAATKGVRRVQRMRQRTAMTGR